MAVCSKRRGTAVSMIQWFKNLPRRWKLAIIWIPSSTTLMAIILFVGTSDASSIPIGMLGGLIMGISSYVYMIRSGGW